jgi:hypothetical protein
MSRPSEASRAMSTSTPPSPSCSTCTPPLKRAEAGQRGAERGKNLQLAREAVGHASDRCLGGRVQGNIDEVRVREVVVQKQSEWRRALVLDSSVAGAYTGKNAAVHRSHWPTSAICHKGSCQALRARPNPRHALFVRIAHREGERTARATLLPTRVLTVPSSRHRGPLFVTAGQRIHVTGPPNRSFSEIKDELGGGAHRQARRGGAGRDNRAHSRAGPW